MSTKVDQVITLAQVLSLLDNSESKKSIVWKEFGNYLDKSVEIENPTINIYQIRKSSFIKFTIYKIYFRQLSGKSYLSQNIAYKICNSCQRPIGTKSLSLHYTKCVAMKQKRQQEQQENAALSNNNNNNTNNSQKKKRGRGSALADVDASSVDSSRNATPAPNGNGNGTGIGAGAGNDNSGKPATKPKKKYKKSQAQKEKEAAAAAAAAAAASSGEKPPKKKKAAASSSSGTTTTTTAGVNTQPQSAPKPKPVAKPKGPVDVEKQCGVALPSGGLCARSLTCKTHSMGAKRAVPGRSAPYDVLLQQYHKRNQANIAKSHAMMLQRRENAAF